MESKSYNVPDRANTRDHIAICFKEMLKAKAFDGISVLELTEVSQVSRSTFYRYFSDKYEVLSWIYKMQLDEIGASSTSFAEGNLKILYLISENKWYFKNVLKNDRENWLANHIFQRSCDFFEHNMKKKMGVNTLSEDTMACIQFFCAGANHLWKTWLFSGCKEPPDTINDRAVANMPELLRNFCD